MMNPQLPPSDLECIRTISRLAAQMEIPILVVGAGARELIFNAPHGIRPHRSTKDWDFGLRVATWDMFRNFKAALLSRGSFRPEYDSEHRLIHKASGVKIDLVPFGGIETDGRIQWPRSHSLMDVIAFSDAYDHATEVELDEGLRVRVATTPLLAALKLLAFADRKNETDRDIKDLWHLMEHYIDAGQSGRLWEEPIISSIGEDFEWTCASAFTLGYDMACVCRPETVSRLMPTIAGLIDPYSPYVASLVGYHESQQAEEMKRQKIGKSFLCLQRGIELAAQKSK